VDGRLVANTYRPPTLAPAFGSWLAVERVLRNLVNHDEAAYAWLMGWLAKLVQAVHAGRPARIGTAPVFFGQKGTGKGVLEECVKALVGPWNVASIGQRELNSDFNSYLDGVLVVFANEVWTSDSRAASGIAKLKDAITCHDRLINKKGVAEVTRRAVENWLLSSNSHRPVEVERGDRRFTLVRTGPPIDVELGRLVADDARAEGPIIRAFLRHLLALPEEALVSDYRPLHTAAKDEVRAASGNSATKFAAQIATHGFWSVTGAWAQSAIGLGPRDLYLVDGANFRALDYGVEPRFPVLLVRRLMEVYRAFATEIAAPVQQEATLLAAIREECPGVIEAVLLVDGRRERVIADLPQPLPETFQAHHAAPEEPLPTQRTLAL
jgi:hypothetical protein